MDIVENNRDLKFINKGNECSLSTALHLLLAQHKIKEAILGKQHKKLTKIVSPQMSFYRKSKCSSALSEHFLPLGG